MQKRRLSSSAGRIRLNQCMIVAFHRAAYKVRSYSYFTLPTSLTLLSDTVSVHTHTRTTWSFIVILKLCHALHRFPVWRHALKNKSVDDVESAWTEHRQDTVYMGTRQQLAKIKCQTITLRGSSIHISSEVTCLSLVIDSELKFTHHIKLVAGKCFYHLRHLHSFRWSLNSDAVKTLANAFITSCVDYCNSMLNGTCAVHLHAVQSILNSSACLIVKKRKYNQIMATIRDELHWLLVQRLDYKLCNFIRVHRRTCHPCVFEIEGHCHLRSAAHGDLVFPLATNKWYRTCSFAVSGSSIWTSLPLATRDLELTFPIFHKLLKTELFRWPYTMP